MNFTDEQIKAAKAAANLEELTALTKEWGIELDADKLEKLFNTIKGGGELADDELDNVAGGCGDHEYIPSDLPHGGKFKV